MTTLAESVLAEGIVYFGQIVSGTAQPLERMPGPAKLEIKPNSELIEAVTKEKGSYGQVVASTAINKPTDLTLSFNAISPAALALALQGSLTAYSQGSGTLQTATATASLGKEIELGKRNIAASSVGVGLASDAKSATITRTSGTATVTCTSHGYATGDKVIIRGANQAEYNGLHTITVSDGNTFTYDVTGTPTTPATGTITSTEASYVEDTDYTVNYAAGFVRPLSTGTIADASSLVLAYGYNAVSGSKIIGATSAQIRTRIYMDGKNLFDGVPLSIEVYEAILTADGAVDWFSDKPIDLSFKGRMVVPAGKTGPLEVIYGQTFS
jgi:hypothetical protein